MEPIYFQPLGIKKEYCEVGIILDTDKDYIHYMNEPFKILISDVKIISKENVVYDKENNLYFVS
jgi:hypothetical protein